LRFGWIRRTRINGDGWTEFDVPLAEESEQYQLRILQNGVVLREEIVDRASWTYTAQMRAADGAAGPALISVAQVSALYGAGPALFGEIKL